MSTVANDYDYVVGVDTHARTHTYTVVETRTGAVIDTASFPVSRPGLARAIAWIRRRTSGIVLAAVEGTSSYGASAVKAFTDNGIPVSEVRPPSRASRTERGKTDAIDAEAAARSVIGRHTSQIRKPRASGDRNALRILLTSRLLMDHQRTADRNALTALLRTVEVGVDARKPLTDTRIKDISTWRTRSNIDLVTMVARSEAKRLASAILNRTKELENNHALLGRHAEELAPGLQDIPGVGPVTAAIIVCAYSHTGRIHSEAAFAALAGVAPQPASSGNTTRHRLNHSGDRQLNRAFDVIVRTRMSFDANTRSYIERGLTSGKTKREIRRNLKRYVCRSIFRQLQTIMA